MDYESLPIKLEPTRDRTDFQLFRDPSSDELYWKEVDRPAMQEELLDDLKRASAQPA